MWWHLPVIPALGRQRQGDLEFEASLVYHNVRPCLKKNFPGKISIAMWKLYVFLLLLNG
jgi:hypothetical protein